MEWETTNKDSELEDNAMEVDVDDFVEKNFMGKLIKLCVQPALAMVKDREKDSPRTTERVKIMLDLLHLQDTPAQGSFLEGLGKQLAMLMKEKEEKSSYGASDWLSVEATKAENISRAGTFRKATLQCLVDKVTPLLAGVVAHVDTNKNLDILKNSQLGHWKHDVWLQVINNPGATLIDYTLMLSSLREQELNEIFVKGTGSDGHVFASQMPFSWLIYRLIENTRLTSELVDVHEDSLSEIVRVTEIVEKADLWQILKPILENNQHESSMAYLNDFIHMVYTAASDQEIQLVCESVLNVCRTTNAQYPGTTVAMFVRFHITYHQLAPRLKNFASIIREWPQCSDNILQLHQKNPQFYLVTDQEMTLDVIGLNLMIEDLTPTKDSLNEEKNRIKWLRKVHKYRPVVERILGQFAVDVDEQKNRRCRKGIDTARNLWTRVVVVKLFIENVCTSEDKSLPVKRCMPLWVMLKDDIDMKRKESLDKVEKFLKSCNKEAVKQYFGAQQECRSCESVIEDRPIKLPCTDVICTKCYNDISILGTDECPVCHYAIPEDFQPKEDGKDKLIIQKYGEFKRRCNSFFMEVVSQLCFADNVAPSKEVIEKLLQYVTRSSRKGGKTVTKEMTIFDDCIDPTPVLRSYLLQLLLRTSSDEVSNHLQMYFENARSFVKDEQDQLVELCLLVIQCLEDSFHQEVSRSVDKFKEEMKMATDMINRASLSLIDEELSVYKLYCLAEARFGLSVVAKYLHEVIVRKSIKADPTFRRLMSAAGRLCDEGGSRWPRLFVVKYLCRCYGIESYQDICSKSEASILRWITLPELKGNQAVECADRYVVCGPQYCQLREGIIQSALNDNSDHLTEYLQKMKVQTWMKPPLMCMALFREVTMASLYPVNKRRITQEAVLTIQKVLDNDPHFNNKKLLTEICDNSLWKYNQDSNISEGMNMRHQNVVCLLVHLYIVLHSLPGDQTIIEPLCRLATKPETMKAAFLPTMPQDDISEIKEALLAARAQHGNENPVIYRCPNGHAYVIGDCGRPATVGMCKECGTEIGGTGYVLRPGNIQDQGIDQTATGHILGRAQNRNLTAAPERGLAPATCAIVRLFTHLAMFCGANINSQAVQEMIKPDIQDVFTFLWEHIQVDLECIHRTLGKSIDDALLFLHDIVNSIMTKHKHNDKISNDMCGLSKKDSRVKWEEEFSRRYLSLPLQNLENMVKDLNKKIMDDKRLGSDPLLCLLYETETQREQTDAAQLHNIPEVWRYRSQITVDHLSQTFSNQVHSKQAHQILRAFLQEEHLLRAIRLVPSIMKLQKILIQKYQRTLDRAEATATSIRQVIQNWTDGDPNELKQLIDDFREAWECVRQKLQNYNCRILTRITSVPKKYSSKPITEESSVSLLLPTHTDAGLCSYILLNYLLRKQNTFLQDYCGLRKLRYNMLPTVQLCNLTAAHLISYHPERDLLPMVLANCNYSFEVGKGTRIEYNFTDFERQLMDRFLFSKSAITELDQIELITYRAETTNAVVFKDLRKRIKQEPLAQTVRRNICEEFRTYPDLCDCLDKLDIAVSFLRSVGGDPMLSIEKFMAQTLKMENPIPSQKACRSCNCKHAQSLWLTLALEKTRRSATYKQNVFEGIEEDFRKELTDLQRNMLKEVCHDEAADKLELFLDVLFECIMLTISVPQNTDDEDFVDMKKLSLAHVMMGYVDSPQFDTEQQYPEWLSELLQKMPSDNSTPDCIFAEQAVDVWLFLFAVHSLKQKERQ